MYSFYGKSQRFSFSIFSSCAFTYLYILSELLCTPSLYAALPQVTGCPTITEANFRYTDLVGNQPVSGQLTEIMKMSFDLNSEGNADIYFTERGNDTRTEPAKVKMYHAQTKTLKTLATLAEVDTRREDGLAGIALDPFFKTNHWIYLYMSVKGYWQVARYRLVGEQLDLTSKTVLLSIKVSEFMPHAGGAIAFDVYGDLWITTGDNGELTTPPCLTDLRGGILRITPLPVADKTVGGLGVTYTVPKGNFGEFFTSKFPEYATAGSVSPEIWAKGTRNPYTLSLNPTKRWAAWGDCGPDMGGITEEHNLATEPGFFGYPFFVGNNLMIHGPQLASNPINPYGSCSGAKKLPPAIPAIHAYERACAMTGPLLFYSPLSKNATKIPPQFHNKWIILDFNKNWAKIGSVGADGKAFTDTLGFFSNWKFDKVLDMQLGPDGAIYVSNYAGYSNWLPTTRISKIEYIGPEISQSCVQAALGVGYVAGCMKKGDPSFNANATIHDASACSQTTPIHHTKSMLAFDIEWNPHQSEISWKAMPSTTNIQPIEIRLLSTSGVLMDSYHPNKMTTHWKPDHLSNGMYVVEMHTTMGHYRKSIAVLSHL